MTLEAIKDEIEHLSEADRHDLLRWLDERDFERWDAELERDFAPGGRGMFLLKEAEADLDEGRFKSMDALLKDRSNPTKGS